MENTTFDNSRTPEIRHASQTDIDNLVTRLNRPITPVKGPPPPKESSEPTITPLTMTKNGEVNLISRLTEDAIRRSRAIEKRQVEKEKKLDKEFAEKQSLHHKTKHDETTFLRLTSPR